MSDDPRGRANRRENSPHTGEAPRPERPVSAANKSGQQARAARERSEQERETPPLDKNGPHLFADDLGHQIGAKVRAIRARRGLSGRKLAAAADVSQPFLSQLEAGHTSVAIATLYRIAAALDVRPSDLLPDPPSGTGVEILRAAELNQMQVSDLPNATTARTAYRGGRRITELGDFRIEPGPDVDEWFESADETVIYVIEGSLHVEFKDRPPVTLSAGDVMFHSAWVQTRWRLASESPARVILVAAGG